MNATPQMVGFPRRLAALVYDAIAVTTVLYFAAFLPVLATSDVLSSAKWVFQLYLLTVLFAYFWVSWRRGRTLGMQAWKIQIVTLAGGRPGLRACVLRFAGALVSAAAFGLGYLAALFDTENRCWHDRWSATRLVRSGSAPRSLPPG